MTFRWEIPSDLRCKKFSIADNPNLWLWKQVEPNLRLLGDRIRTSIAHDYVSPDSSVELPLKDVTMEDCTFFILRGLQKDLLELLRLNARRIKSTQVGRFLQLSTYCFATGLSPERWFNEHATDDFKKVSLHLSYTPTVSAVCCVRPL